MAKDVVDYCLGCLHCAEHGPATRSQTLAKVQVKAPMDCLGVDFIGLFSKCEFNGVTYGYILLINLTTFPDSSGVFRALLMTVRKSLKHLQNSFLSMALQSDSMLTPDRTSARKSRLF
jgi:hypothetical protein